MDVADEQAMRERFLAALAASGMTKMELARKAGIPHTTLYSYCSGKTAQLQSTKQALLAQALDTTVAALFTGYGAAESAPVLGAFGGRGGVQSVDGPTVRVELPAGVPAGNYVAYDIGALHMPPAEAGWAAFFEATPSDLSEVLNTVGLVEVTDGRTLFRRLRRGYTEGTFNLEAWDGSPLLENQEVISFRRFVALVAAPTPVGG